MTVCVLAIVCILLLAATIAFLHRREGIAEICKRIRKMSKCVLLFSVICLVGVIVLSSTFSYTSDYLKSVLSVEFMTEVREVLRELFGTESVFTSLQMVGACSLFVCSFTVCTFYVCGAIVYLIPTQSHDKDGVEEYEAKVVDLPGTICVRRFAVFSRYLI